MNLVIDAKREEFIRDGVPVHLSARQREALTLVIAGNGRPVHGAHIAEEMETTETNVRMLIWAIRRKLGEDVIVAESTAGYRWNFRPERCPTCGRVA